MERAEVMQPAVAEVKLRPLLILLAAMLLAGCQTTASESPLATTESTASTAAAAVEEVEEEPMTRARASGECWMRLEKTRPGGSLEARAAIVEKCIDEKMNAAKQAQVVPQPKPRPQQ